MSRNELAKLMKGMSVKHNLYNIFTDFCKLGATTISNGIDKQQFEKREEKYMQTIKKYTRDEANNFAKMLAVLTAGLERNVTDILGETYMQLEISNKHVGQFFTPIGIAKLMAELTVGDYIQEIDKNGHITVNEPSVGGGVTIIGLAAALQKRGYNYQKCMKAVVQDIDVDLVHMCYLQLSLLGIDAVVMRGDTLAYEFDDFWYTPVHILNRIQEQKEDRTKNMITGMKKSIELEDEKKPEKLLQLSLF